MAAWKTGSGHWSLISNENYPSKSSPMKKFKTTAAMLLLLFCMACGNHRSSIEGRYIIFLKDEYSLAWDTLKISAIADKENTFKIEKETGYQRISNGRLMRKGYAHGCGSPIGTNRLEPLENRCIIRPSGSLLTACCSKTRLIENYRNS
jgi:hypothetical protein